MGFEIVTGTSSQLQMISLIISELFYNSELFYLLNWLQTLNCLKQTSRFCTSQSIFDPNAYYERLYSEEVTTAYHERVKISPLTLRSPDDCLEIFHRRVRSSLLKSIFWSCRWSWRQKCTGCIARTRVWRKIWTTLRLCKEISSSCLNHSKSSWRRSVVRRRRCGGRTPRTLKSAILVTADFRVQGRRCPSPPNCFLPFLFELDHRLQIWI